MSYFDHFIELDNIDGLLIVQGRKLIEDVLINPGISIKCPCCRRRIEVRKETVTHSKVEIMRLMYDHNKKNPIHVNTVLKPENRSFTVLKHWGLIKQVDGDLRGEESTTSGLWRVTTRGEMFLFGFYYVPDYIFIFNDIKLSESNKLISIYNIKKR